MSKQNKSLAREAPGSHLPAGIACAPQRPPWNIIIIIIIMIIIINIIITIVIVIIIVHITIILFLLL